MLQKFKNKWNIKSNLQLIIILVVFSVTGSAALVVRKFAFHLLGIQPDTSLFIKVPLYILILFPSYHFLLLIIGTLAGQYRFFYAFQKKSLAFLSRKNRKLQ
jgi:protoporphyrin/coproporphyrin ferrochelatase